MKQRHRRHLHRYDLVVVHALPNVDFVGPPRVEIACSDGLTGFVEHLVSDMTAVDHPRLKRHVLGTHFHVPASAASREVQHELAVQLTRILTAVARHRAFHVVFGAVSILKLSGDREPRITIDEEPWAR